MIFWHNLFRYPRFFFSSIIGLVFVILNPFLAVLKGTQKKDSNVFFIIAIISIFLCLLRILIFILQQMFLFE